jgi:glycosyltransferase involved in cell wall biosynthesis
VFSLADRILPVSNFTARELQRNVGVNLSKVQVIHHGFESPKNPDIQNKADRVVTITNLSWSDLKRKGLETLVHSAKLLPDVDFIIIGPIVDDSIKKLQEISPSNVNFAGYVKNAANSDLLRTAKVYVQLSFYESFGCGLAEAMLQGCIPVVTCNGALPELVGDTGYLVPYGDIQASVKAIQQALNTGPEAGLRARTRILKQFPLEKRHTQLLQTLKI